MNATTIREQRLDSLIDWAERKKHKTFDEIFSEVRTRYPKLTKRTQHDYAEAVIRAITANNPTQQKVEE